jgi:hypothetical protein
MGNHTLHPDPDMSELFEMLTMITRRRKAVAGSPFVTVKATEKWLKNLPSDSEYDTHHALVQGLERFNVENVPASLKRMQSLLLIEAAGLPLQRGIVDQYVRNQASFRLARQALWRESWSFWSLLADAWLGMLKQAYRSPASAELKPKAPQIAARALRYAGLVMRWDFHQVRNPPESAWRRVNKIFRLVEHGGYSTKEVLIDGRPTHCAREYSLLAIMGLISPLGYRPEEIESIAQLIEGYSPLPLPASVPLRHAHTHIVDLSLAEGASVMDATCVEGKRLRYFAMRAMVDYLKSVEHPVTDEAGNSLGQQVASLIERGGIRRNRHRSHRFGSAWVTTGMDKILTVLAHPDASDERLSLEPWMLRDESMEGMGLVLPDARTLPHGRLLAVTLDPAENTWQLLVTRWSRQEDGQNLVGAERLSRHPKRVEIFSDDKADAGQSKTWGVFLPMTHTGQGPSNLLLPRAYYALGAALSLRDGEVIYRLRLGEVQESHDAWLRVGMEVVGREQLAVAA